MMNKRDYFDNIAKNRLKWKKKNYYYNYLIEKYIKFNIEPNSKVLEIGCGTGELLNAVEPKFGLGIDFSKNMISIAKEKFPNLHFAVMDAQGLKINEKFDYIIMSDLIGSLDDIQIVFSNVYKLCCKKTRIIISFYNYLWEPLLVFAEKIKLKERLPKQNWLTINDIKNLLNIENFEIIKIDKKILIPYKIPLLSNFFNKFIVNLPLVNNLALTNIIIARKNVNHESIDDKSVSIIIPAKNEEKNIENAIRRIPKFGIKQEIIFVEGNSNDCTYDEMLRVKEKYNEMDIKVVKQDGKGKGDAVRKGFDLAQGEVLIILDADLTTPPEDLYKFYYALIKNKGEFINGCRLVYPMEKQAMRFLNMIANKLFGIFFTYLLGQPLKDTLCGTKVLFRSDYSRIKKNREYFGDFDPFGDFDLLFGASKLNLKIVEIPVRYKQREFGETQIKRFSNGWMLLKMCVFAAKKIKFF